VILLDTDAPSALRKCEPEVRVVEWLDARPPAE